VRLPPAKARDGAQRSEGGTEAYSRTYTTQHRKGTEANEMKRLTEGRSDLLIPHQPVREGIPRSPTQPLRTGNTKNCSLLSGSSF